MKKPIFAVMIIVISIMCISILPQMIFASEEENISKFLVKQKILIVYFSHTGNTREIANQIQKKTGGDIFEIKTVVPYTDGYSALTKKAREELDSDFMPKLQSQIQNINSYDVIFIGYPNWWGTYPMAVKAFLSEHDFSGKTIIPFCTHEGSGLGRSVSDLKKMCPNSTILEGLAVRGSAVNSAQDKVSAWLLDIK